MRVFSVIIFSPDDHIAYDLNTLDDIGLGGGATARIRMAHALAGRGHRVDLYINCPQEKYIEGVNYHHFKSFQSQKADIFIASSSGGGLSLAGLLSIPSANISKILLIEGDEFPIDVNLMNFDHYYVLSNYVRKKLFSRHPEYNRYFVTNHGIQKSQFERGSINNDPHKLAYASHPSKGLKSAIMVFEKIKRQDKRFELHVFGDERLWGGKLASILSNFQETSGIINHSLIGQKLLAKELMSCGFYIALQSRPEPFGIIIGEAQFAGCIVLASPAGAFSEIINNGINGYLFEGNPEDASTIANIVSKIMELTENPKIMEQVRANGEKTPIDWQVCAETWVAHWNWILNHPEHNNSSAPQVCEECGGEEISFKDGIHCLKCGRFRR